MSAFVLRTLPHCSSNTNPPRQSQLPSRSPPAPKELARLPASFVREHVNDQGNLQLQTAITTFTRGRKRLHLHAVLHIADGAYYAAVQRDAARLAARGGLTLFELVLPDNSASSRRNARVVRTQPARRYDGLPVLTQPVAATPAARGAARALRAVAQADALDLCAPGWVHAESAAPPWTEDADADADMDESDNAALQDDDDDEDGDSDVARRGRDERDMAPKQNVEDRVTWNYNDTPAATTITTRAAVAAAGASRLARKAALAAAAALLAPVALLALPGPEVWACAWLVSSGRAAVGPATVGAAARLRGVVARRAAYAARAAASARLSRAAGTGTDTGSGSGSGSGSGGGSGGRSGRQRRPEAETTTGTRSSTGTDIGNAGIETTTARRRRGSTTAGAPHTPKTSKTRTDTATRNARAWRTTQAVLRGRDEAALVFGAWHAGALARAARSDGWAVEQVSWRDALLVGDRARDLRVGAPQVAAVAVAAAAALAYAAADWVAVVQALLACATGESAWDAPVAAMVALYAVRHAAPVVAFWRWFRVWSDDDGE